ncbi:cation diffusion facilitator family transporter [Spirosoma utsteinense]|uniref:Cation diffusion facilitator family transporter n=1 Tax=Spirosoma utsteinense TaxID=2585773 RepID=A0ABR6WBR6_9BACT|nr:cation diffusion facilitator family transporter [Spirosoma utsteinense]MBC3787043.1 cation diffusion facilitator family transporter [Spirosoma utsteinense]MBC3793376.1 cation diffusion facilitator family transporter [Spirosoma utsteinense]
MEPSTLEPHKARRGEKTTLVGIAVNIGLVLVKGTAGWLGNSYALIADALESATDIVTSIFVWFGLRTASKAPDRNHPYGHGKAEPLAAMVVALALVGAAVLIAVQSVQNIQTPHEIPKPFTLAVLAGVVVIKEILFRRIAKVGAEVESSAVKADAWHHRSDAITSLTAFIGIGVALIGGPGYESADDWAALLASGFIIYNAYHIFRPSFGEIMDETPAGDWQPELEAIARQIPHVKGIDKYRVRKTGFEYFVDLHVLVPGELSVSEGHTIAHAVKAAIIAEKPAVYDVLVHIEPV